jgi:hypothetical protein
MPRSRPCRPPSRGPAPSSSTRAAACTWCRSPAGRRRGYWWRGAGWPSRRSIRAGRWCTSPIRAASSPGFRSPAARSSGCYPDETSWAAPSPVDDELLFVRGPRGASLPYRHALGADRPLSAELHPGLWGPIVLSPDGARVALHEGGSTIYEVERATGKILRVLPGGKAYFLGATYLGDELIVARTQYQGDLWTGKVRR